MTSSRTATIEALEGRCLFTVWAVTPLSVPVLIGPGYAPTADPAATRGTAAKPRPAGHRGGHSNHSHVAAPAPATSVVTAPAPAPARATSLVGHWEGEVKVKVFIFTKEVTVAFDVTDQTDTTLTGSVTIGGRQLAGTFTGHVNGTSGRFTYRIRQGDASAKIRGRLNSAGTRMAGEMSGDSGTTSADGDFDLKKGRK